MIEQKIDVVIIQELYTGSTGKINKSSFNREIFQKSSVISPVKAAIIVLNKTVVSTCVLVQKCSNNCNNVIEAQIVNKYFSCHMPNEDIDVSLGKLSQLLDMNNKKIGSGC